MDWASFFSKWTGLKSSFGFRKNRQQPKQGKQKIAWQILEFSPQKKLGKEELKVELVKSSEKQGEKKFASQILEFSQKKPGKEELRVELVKSSEKQGKKNFMQII